MTRHEAIDLAFEIKRNPEKDFDFSSLLYSAVGMVKLEKDLGATFAAMKLVEAIEEASKGKLSDFCKRRIDIIESAHTKRLNSNFDKWAKAREIADYNREVAAMRAAEQKAAQEFEETEV